MSRATPMAPDERRQAIIDATLPLLLAQGPEISTREIAHAACVAEGTIFRAFETKQELIHATMEAALRPDSALASLAGLPPEQRLEQRVAAILDVLRDEIRRTRSVFAHFTRPIIPHVPPAGARSCPPINPHESKARIAEGAAVALEPYAAQLAVPTLIAAQLLSALAFATSLGLADDHPINQSSALADVVLHGIAKGDS
ncbi:MAG: TetR/AcrR family transcriptional regulator [Propionicimonas sp.]